MEPKSDRDQLQWQEGNTGVARTFNYPPRAPASSKDSWQTSLEGMWDNVFARTWLISFKPSVLFCAWHGNQVKIIRVHHLRLHVEDSPLKMLLSWPSSFRAGTRPRLNNIKPLGRNPFQRCVSPLDLKTSKHFGALKWERWLGVFLSCLMEPSWNTHLRVSLYFL